MKYRAWMLAAFAAAGVVALTACTSSQEEIAQNVRTESSGNGDTADAGNSDEAVGQQEAPQGAGTDAGASGVSDGQIQTSGVTEEPDLTETEPDAPETVRTEASGDSAAEADSEDIWTGTYVGDQDTVTISLIDAESFSFSFANSGIASTAELDGTTAVYRGDDYHDVVFEMDEGVLHITVSSEEDYDASASPLNGTYVRQQLITEYSDASETEWGEEES